MANEILYAAPAANEDAIVTLPAQDALRHWMLGISWSYSAAPTNGSLIIYDDDDVVFSIDVVVAGANSVEVQRVSGPGHELRIVLSAGGAGVVGKVNVNRHAITVGVPTQWIDT